jgi:transposase
LLQERGLTLPKGRSHLEEALPGILVDVNPKLSDSFRVLLAQLRIELAQLAARIEEMEAVMQQTAKENEACERLTTIPGIGPVATAAVSNWLARLVARARTRVATGRALPSGNVRTAYPENIPKKSCTK